MWSYLIMNWLLSYFHSLPYVYQFFFVFMCEVVKTDIFFIPIFAEFFNFL